MEKSSRTIVIATGGFDPLHQGHLSYLHNASKLGDLLYVGVNSDKWLKQKKGFYFLDEITRRNIIGSLSCVYVAGIICKNAENDAGWYIQNICYLYKDENVKIIFANGGDRTPENIPEMNIKYSKNVKFVFGIGGYRKVDSSTNILKRYENHILEKNGVMKKVF